MITIAGLAAPDRPEIDVLLDARFGPARRNRTAYRLRDGADALPQLSFVAREQGALVGSVQCWPMRLRGLAGDVHPLILLGPLAVAATHEGQGIASALMRTALAAVDATAAPPVVLIGDAPFYGRFGFAASGTAGWHVPGPVDRARLLQRGGTDLPPVGWLQPAGGTVRRAA